MLLNGLEFFASQHLRFATTLEVRTTHLQPRYLQGEERDRMNCGDGLIVERTELFGQSAVADLTKGMAAIEA
jgi:hypothetical protein